MRRLFLALLLWLLVAPAALADPAQMPIERQVLVLLRLPPAHLRPGAAYSDGYGAGGGAAARRRIALRLAATHGLTLVTDWPMPLVGLDCYVMAAPEGRSAEAEAEALSREPGVEWAQPMGEFHGRASVAPNDPMFRLQPAAQAWRLADLREVATGRGVRVAVVDSRIDAAHPDLAGQVAVQRDFVAARPGGPERHGTGVAGVIGAIADNRQGIAGVAPGARLMGLRACWQAAASDTVCDTLSLARAVSFAAESGAQVINLSLAGPPDPLLGRLIDAALARGAVVVGAVDPALPRGGFPASHPGVIAVSSDGSGGAFTAPGRDVPTTEPGGGWTLATGSSYSAAHVSGLVALMLEHNPRVRPLASLAASRNGGAIDPCASLMRTAAPCRDCACAKTPHPATLARP